MSLVTVAIPTLNRRKLFEKCLASVLGQTFADFEVHVFDNGSTDGTAEFMAEVDDPRVVYHRRPSTVPQWMNLTDCLHAGSSPFVQVLFDDDYMLPTNLERKVAVLNTAHEVVLVHSPFEVSTEDGTIVDQLASWNPPPTSRIDPPDVSISEMFRSGNRVPISSALIRRSAVFGDGFDPRDALTDFALVLRIASRGRLAYIDEPLFGQTLTAGYSVANGTYVVDGNEPGRKLTLAWVASSRAVLFQFLRGYGCSPSRHRSLQTAAHTWSRAAICRLIDDLGLTSRRATIAFWAKAVRVEPTLLKSPTSARCAWRSLRRVHVPEHDEPSSNA